MTLEDIPAAHRSEVNRFPEALRRLVLAELAAGNAIQESGGGFPAPPCGSLIELSRPMTTPPPSEDGGVRPVRYPNARLQAGYSDVKGHFFVMNPPPPPPPEPDMEAIRAAMTAREVESLASRERVAAEEVRRDSTAVAPAPAAVAESAFERFLASLSLDYEKWREGIGYDLAAIRSAGAVEREMIEETLLGRGIQGWREVEALAEFETPRSRRALKEALVAGNPEVSMAVLRHRPRLATPKQRTDAIVRALGEGVLFGGLSEALEQAEAHHPPEVMAALLRGARERPGDVAGHLAGLLLYLHGQAAARFDWDQRPFLLRFNTDDASLRETVFRELCVRIGVDAEAGREPAKTPGHRRTAGTSRKAAKGSTL